MLGRSSALPFVANSPAIADKWRLLAHPDLVETLHLVARTQRCRAEHLVDGDDSGAADATITSLRREKDDVTEVSAGYECGMVLSYPDIQVGDIIEVFEQVEVPRT